MYGTTPGFREVQQTLDGGYVAVGDLVVGTRPHDCGAYLRICFDRAGRCRLADVLWSRTYGPQAYDVHWSFSSVDRHKRRLLPGPAFRLEKTAQVHAGRQPADSTNPKGQGVRPGPWPAPVQTAELLWWPKPLLPPRDTRGIRMLIKTDSAGDILWQRLYPGSELNAIQGLPDGGYIASGLLERPLGASSVVLVGWVVRVDPLGNIIWQKTYDPTSGPFRSVRQTSDGGYIVLGNPILKLDSEGLPQWEKLYSSGTPSTACIRQSTEGTSPVVAVGRREPEMLTGGW